MMLLKQLKKKNYLTMIENAAKGENLMFRNLYVEIGGKKKDVLDDGKLSCAVFASSVLYLNKMINDLHATVKRTVEDLFDSGWRETNELQPGAVLVWEKKDSGDGQSHAHIGFYIGNDMAVSNNSYNGGVPTKHHYTYNNTRKIEKILWYPGLEGK
jgi:hypothetical protein